jgi:hypothetical protein
VFPGGDAGPDEDGGDLAFPVVEDGAFPGDFGEAGGQFSPRRLREYPVAQGVAAPLVVGKLIGDLV